MCLQPRYCPDLAVHENFTVRFSARRLGTKVNLAAVSMRWNLLFPVSRMQAMPAWFTCVEGRASFASCRSGSFQLGRGSCARPSPLHRGVNDSSAETPDVGKMHVWQRVPFGVPSSRWAVCSLPQALKWLTQRSLRGGWAGVSAAASLLWQPEEAPEFLDPADLQNEQLGCTGGKLLKELRSQRNVHQPMILS